MTKNHLSFYIMGGFGHIKPALALSEQFRRQHKIPSHTLDIYSQTTKPNPQAANFYHTISRSATLTPLWNLITRHDLLPSWIFAPVHWLETIHNRQIIHRLASLETKYPNPIITATHFTAALLAAKAFPHQTIFLYVTDIYPHGLWKLNPKNIHYLVPMEETKITLTHHHIPPEHITISSFPVPYQLIDHQYTRFQKRLNHLKTKNPKQIDVLVISGGAGTGKKEMTRLLNQFSIPAKANQVKLTFLVSTKSLRNYLIDYCAHKCKTHKHQIFIDLYTPKSLYPALKKAEILVTKAGGDITFEALAEGLPIYTLKDIGDHERLNRQYLELIGASKPLFHTKAPWDLIQSDILTGEIVLMAQSSHDHGKIHRQANTPKIIQKLLS